MESEAVVAFVKAMCAVSLEELEARCPRVYTLAKIVEIAHFNMDRIRLVWGRIWNVLSEFFITVGLLRNLRVAMYVVDSLRQLSMKFLARDELTNYTFQNDFLKPCVGGMSCELGRKKPDPMPGFDFVSRAPLAEACAVLCRRVLCCAGMS